MRKLTRKSTSPKHPPEWVAIRLRGSPYWWNGYGFTQSIVLHPRFAVSNLLIHMRTCYHLDVELIDLYHLDKEDERMHINRPRTYMQYSPIEDDEDDD